MEDKSIINVEDKLIVERIEIDSTSSQKTNEQSIDKLLITEISFYVCSAILLLFAIICYNEDLHCKSSPFDFFEKRYVGGDAYNFIISAARSSAIVTKSLIWTVLSCTSLIAGRLTGIQRTKAPKN